MVLGCDKIGNTADADLDAWPAAIRALAKLPASVVIPGHGDRIDPELLPSTLEVLAEVHAPRAPADGQPDGR
jgi:glyoxylase-like metal-dependent hydrolase (beta-lactamase superfamily II)